MWTLILVLQFAAVPNVAQLDGMNATLEGGSVKVSVPWYETRAACESAVATVPTTFDGVAVTVERFSCQKTD